MCMVCGCDTNAAGPVDAGVEMLHLAGDLHHDSGLARMSVAAVWPARAAQIEADVLGENKRLARANRAHFAAHRVTAFNLLSSPGSGKTTLLCASIEALKQRAPRLRLAVIEGDQQTRIDADRIRATGAPAIQINTGRGCHLDAQMVGDAFARLDLHDDGHQAAAEDSLLFIENVGNLVCPALWDLGEMAKVVVLSVTEGDDKPLKYPDMFSVATLMVINKIDLLPHVDFDVARCIEFARRVNPGIGVLLLSATCGDGMGAWLDWVLGPGIEGPGANLSPPGLVGEGAHA